MKPTPRAARRCVTRTSRRDPHGAHMESMATEFALLAQRRTRLARQVDLLTHRLAAANASLQQVHARMGVLAQHMDTIDPALRPATLAQAPVARPEAAARPPAYAPPPPAYKGPLYPPPKPAYQAAQPPFRAQHGLPAEQPAPDPKPIGRAKPPPRLVRPVPRRRPFLAE